ncbi:hypothetical protein D3C85_14900 [compost metagenome]
MSVLRTHRGFVLDNKSSQPEGFVELPVVESLYHRMETTHDWADDFDYLEQVIAAAKQLLFSRDGRFILTSQLKEPTSAWVLKFTASTLNFLNGTARQLSLENFRDLMVFHPKDVASYDHARAIRENNWGWMFQATPGEIISAWLSQEDGLTDLVMSLYLIGSPLPSDWHGKSEAL